MVIASPFLNRFGQIIIRFNHNKITKHHNKTTQQTSSKTWKYLNYIRSYTMPKLKKKKKLDLAFFFKKSISHIIACSFDIFRSIYKLGLFLKVGFKLQLISQSYHVGSIGYRFGDLQNWPIFKKKFDFDPSAKNLHDPDHDKR